MLLTLAVFILVLSLLVFVHEFGHFIVAKKSGIRVDEFGFGIPPRIWGKKVGETLYSINLLPIGGFVKLAGEDEEEKKDIKDRNRQFWAKPKLVRAAVIVAGVVMNFLLAVVVFSIVYAQTGIPTKTNRVTIDGVLPSAPAAQAGLKEGDVVVSVNGEQINSNGQFIELTKKYAGQAVELKIVRSGTNDNLALTVTPRKDPPEGEGSLGIAISDVQMKFYPFYQMPFRGAVEGFKEAVGWAGLILTSLVDMVWRLVSMGVVPKDVAGPIGIFQITGTVAKGGILPVLQFLGILSVNLALINILPFPALDGGRLLFIGIEAVARRKVKVEAERWAHQIGMALLLFLILLITYNDIIRLIGTTSLGTYLHKLFPNSP